MDTDIVQGLQVTAIGMGLVFLTLIIVALIIWALGQVFKYKAEAADEEEAAEEEAVAPLAAAAIGDDGSDEAVAVALALAMEQRKLAAAIAVAVAVERSNGNRQIEYEDLQGETVMVTMIDPGPGTWSAYGRAKIMQQ